MCLPASRPSPPAQELFAELGPDWVDQVEAGDIKEYPLNSHDTEGMHHLCAVLAGTAYLPGKKPGGAGGGARASGASGLSFSKNHQFSAVVSGSQAV